jgi:hypothetical protein
MHGVECRADTLAGWIVTPLHCTLHRPSWLQCLARLPHQPVCTALDVSRLPCTAEHYRGYEMVMP